MQKTIILLLVLFSLSQAIDLKGNFSTGIQSGTPYWNSDNTNKDIPVDDGFNRTLNHLRLTAKSGVFQFKFNALRSDGFQSDNRLSETKIYQAYGLYTFNNGDIRVGRFVPFKRWIWSSVDGAAASVDVNSNWQINALGGIQVPYGLLYDSDQAIGLGYADIAYHSGAYSAKVKYYQDENVAKTGADFAAKMGKLRVSGNYGYDLTNKTIADGGLGLYYYASPKWNIMANYRLFSIVPGKITYFEFGNQLIERGILGTSYRLGTSYWLTFRQMVTMTNENTDYLSYLTFSHKYFTLGVSYLGGDTELKRIALIAAAHYTVLKNLRLSTGAAPVNYLLQDQDEHMTSIAYYFRADYRLLSALNVRFNLHYYQYDSNLNTHPLDATVRGGLQFTYYFGS